MPLRLLIVDDEPPARARLRRLLAARPDVQVVGEATDGLQALAQAEALRPDALLLDVQMPGPSGLDVAASLPDGDGGAPAVVFVTAFDDYALPAFDAAAVDYLLKPVDPARLARALDRIRQRRAPGGTRPAAARLVVAERGQLRVIDCCRPPTTMSSCTPRSACTCCAARSMRCSPTWARASCASTAAARWRWRP